MPGPILVVDDEADIRRLLQWALEEEGYRVRAAANGQEALSCVAEDCPALVLLDLNMPVMTGWELLVRLRDTHVEIPVVFMTAGQEAQAEAERCHADGYVAKPFDLATVFDVVGRFAAA